MESQGNGRRIRRIHLAGGCFWGLEKYMSLIPGVVSTQVGYANGRTEKPTYEYNWSRGKVHDIAYLGGHSVFYVELPSGKLVQSFVANAERRGARPTWDDEVYVWWEDDSGVVLRS